jgi:hypothetical protein
MARYFVGGGPTVRFCRTCGASYPSAQSRGLGEGQRASPRGGCVASSDAAARVPGREPLSPATGELAVAANPVSCLRVASSRAATDFGHDEFPLYAQRLPASQEMAAARLGDARRRRWISYTWRRLRAAARRELLRRAACASWCPIRPAQSPAGQGNRVQALPS